MLSKIKNIKIENLLLIFFIAQPLIDIYKAFYRDTISCCGIAIEEIFNIFMVGVIFLFTIYKIVTEKNRNFKEILIYAIYIAVTGIYLILHYINISKFNSNVYNLANINFITENYYIFRTYLIPLILLGLVTKSGMSNQKFNKIITIVVLIMSSVIVIANIFKVGLVSYNQENTFIDGNIFQWITMDENTNYAAYTSKGWFCGTNEISALMLSLAPIIIIQAIQKNKIRYYLLVVLQAVSMVMIGTKTSALGVCAMLIVIPLLAGFLYITKLDKTFKWKVSIPVTLLIFGIIAGLYQISPTKMKLAVDKAGKEEVRVAAEEKYQFAKTSTDEDKGQDVLEKQEEEEALNLEEYIYKYSYNYYINEWFLELYPVKNDISFWSNVITRDSRLNIDNRTFKIEMIERIISRNNNKLDKILGIGYTSNVPYTEKDYYYQYFIFGIIGLIILLGPCIAIAIYGGIKILLKYKEKFNLENVSPLIALICILGIGYVSGHVWGMPINMYFMSLYAGILLLNTQKGKIEEKE